MPLRDIILIDESKCDGCALCIPSCPEGALAIINGKARLVSDSLCDGMGACVGECPQGAMTVIKRDAPQFDLASAITNADTILKAKPAARKSANDFAGCPGSRAMSIERSLNATKSDSIPSNRTSELTQWPIQLRLVSPLAPYFNSRNLLIAADCVAFSDANFHGNLLKGRSLAIACPKLDDPSGYIAKLSAIIKNNDIPCVLVVIMEVPCCRGLLSMVEMAVADSGKEMEIDLIVVKVDGEYISSNGKI
jgi:Fe-S-cluster-containing hydrogenase component 2